MNAEIESLLQRTRKKQRRQEEQLVAQAKDLLQRNLFSEEHVLKNLREYSRSFDNMDRDDCHPDLLYTPEEIKDVAVRFRLKFLDSATFKFDFPSEAIIKITELNRQHRKDLKAFKILAHPTAFSSDYKNESCTLFVKTSDENYFLIHSWGQPISQFRRIRFWPVRTFENIAAFVFLLSIVVTLALPTEWITLDSEATYWSGYRGGTLFHLLFFFTGFTVYLTMAFGIRLSTTVWDRQRPSQK